MTRRLVSKLSCVLILLLLSTFLPAQTKWEKRMQGLPPGEVFYCVALGDSASAWISSPQGIWRSSNFGVNWTQVTFPTSSGSPTVFVASSYREAMYATSSGKILKTSNAGETWAKVFDDTAVTTFINDMEIFDGSHGYAIGDPPNSSSHPGLVRTTDGGWTWNVVPNNLPLGDIQNPGRTDFIRPNIGWSKGFNDGIYKTTNGGSDWALIFTSHFPHYIAFLNDTIGVCNTIRPSSNVTYKTLDGGVGWDSTHSGGSFSFFCWAPSGSHVWGGSDTLFMSTDQGSTWLPQFTAKSIGAVNSSFNEGAFSSDDSGMVVGNGVVIALIKDPATITDPERSLPTATILRQNYPNPFNPTTAVSYQLSAVSKTTIVVFDMLGRAVATLLDETRGPGSYTVDWNASGMPSGIYFCRMTAGARVFTIKLALVK